MALIKCPDCGKMFSEYAERCPDCGCPTEDVKAANKEDDSPISQNIEVTAIDEQPSSNVADNLEDESVSQESIQPSTEDDESAVVEEKNHIHKWLGGVGFIAVLITIVFIIASPFFGSQKKDNDTAQEETAQIESLEGIEGNAFTEPRTYTYKDVWEVEMDDGDGNASNVEASLSVTIIFTPQSSVRIKYEVQDIDEWEGTYTTDGKTVTMNVQNVYDSARKEVVTAKLEGDKLVLDNNNVCGIFLLKRSGVSGKGDKEQQIFGRVQYIFQNLPNHKSIEEVDNTVFTPSFLTVLEKSNGYWDMLAASDGEELAFESAFFWYQGNEIDPDGKLISVC